MVEYKKVTPTCWQEHNVGCSSIPATANLCPATMTESTSLPVHVETKFLSRQKLRMENILASTSLNRLFLLLFSIGCAVHAGPWLPPESISSLAIFLQPLSTHFLLIIFNIETDHLRKCKLVQRFNAFKYTSL